MGYEVVSRRESSGACRLHNRKGTQHGTLAMVTFFLWFCVIRIFFVLLAQKNPVIVMNLEHGLKNNRCTYIDLSHPFSSPLFISKSNEGNDHAIHKSH